MNKEKPDNDRLAYRIGGINLSGLTMTKVILWLVAITIVCLAIGFGILALSEGQSSSSENKVSLFRNTAAFSPNTTTIPLDGAATGIIRITMGAGENAVRGHAPATALMESTIFAAPEWQPQIRSTVNGSQKTVTLIQKGNKENGWFTDRSPHRWEVRVSETVPIDLSVEVGAGHSILELGTLNLTSLRFSSGAGETEIDIRSYHGRPYSAEIHNGVGDLTLRIDNKSNTRVRIRQGVGHITVNGIEQTSETYTTAGFNPALPVNEIALTQGVGSIQLEAV